MMEAVVPDFRARRIGGREARLLCDQAGVRVEMGRMVTSAMCPPPIFGQRYIFVSRRVPSAAMAFVLLHELTHVLAGDADELVELVLDESRYPPEDRVADGVAAIGVTSAAERMWPREELAERLRQLAPIQGRAWQAYRSNDVAALIREPED